MPMQIKRGTNTQRLSYTPSEGELVFVTNYVSAGVDPLWIGDGTTVGGKTVSSSGSGLTELASDTTPELGGNLDLAGFEITGIGDIDITGTISSTGAITSPAFVGDFKGSVFADDSSPIVDATTGQVTASIINSTNIAAAGNLNIDNTLGGAAQVFVNSTDNTSAVNFFRSSAGTVNPTSQIGAMYFTKSDTGGDVTTGTITSTSLSILIGHNSSGIGGDSSNFLSWNGTNLGVGTFEGTTKIEIKEGSLRLNDTRLLSSIGTPLSGEVKYEAADGALYVYTGSQWTKVISEGLVSDDTLLQSFLFLGLKDTAARNALGADSSSIDGAIFYNTDVDRVEVFQAGSWIKIPNNGTDIGQVLTWNGNEWVGTNPATGGSVISADQLDGFEGSYYLDFANHTNTPTTLTGYGITDAVLSSELGNFTFTGNVLDSADSSPLAVTPSVTFSSDVTVENNLIVNNKITVDTLEVTNLQTVGAGTPELTSDTDILLSAGTRVEITQSPFKVASFTTAERDALSAENGDLIYNTTANKFQGYENGSWVNLV